MSEDERRKLSRDLLANLRRDREARDAVAAASTSDNKTVAMQTVVRLMRAHDDLRATFRDQLDDGDVAGATATKAQMDELSLLLISLNRGIIDFLDGAADVADAKTKLESVTKDLTDAAKRTRTDTAALTDVASAVDLLAELVNS